jgi:hypothetical protein
MFYHLAKPSNERRRKMFFLAPLSLILSIPLQQQEKHKGYFLPSCVKNFKFFFFQCKKHTVGTVLENIAFLELYREE